MINYWLVNLNTLVLVLLEWSLFSWLKGVWVIEQCRMHVGRSVALPISHLVWCLDMPPSHTWTDSQFWYSNGQEKDTWDAPGHYEGHEEQRMLNFSEHCLVTNISVCHPPPIYTRFFPCFWQRSTFFISPDLICPHEMNFWFICIARHPMFTVLVTCQTYPTFPLTVTETSVFSSFVLKFLFSMCVTLSRCN